MITTLTIRTNKMLIVLLMETYGIENDTENDIFVRYDGYVYARDFMTTRQFNIQKVLKKINRNYISRKDII